MKAYMRLNKTKVRVERMKVSLNLRKTLKQICDKVN